MRYASDPQVIAVAGRGHPWPRRSLQQPGACLLVAAPGASDGAGLFTDRSPGDAGANFLNYFPPNEHMNDYAFDALGFWALRRPPPSCPA